MILRIIILLLLVGTLQAQNYHTFNVPVSVGGATNASSLLTLNSTTQGFLIPRMTTAQRDAIPTPAVGLQIYNTETNTINIFNGTWVALSGGGGIGGTIAAGQVAFGSASNTLSGSNNLFWDNANGRLGVGLNAPTATAHVRGSFAPVGGSDAYEVLNIDGTINQTGGASGITRGIRVNPTLSAASDWRSIEWSNNTGWGLYGAGTANNYLGGALSIGTLSPTQGIRIGRNPTLAQSSTIFVNVAIQSSVNSVYRGYATSIGLNASGFTLPNLSHFEAVNDGNHTAGVVTNLYGFRENLGTYNATNVFGFHGNIPSGTGRWNLYMNGTADNYLNGGLAIGVTNTYGLKLAVAGSTYLGGQVAIGTSVPSGNTSLRVFRAFPASNSTAIDQNSPISNDAVVTGIIGYSNSFSKTTTSTLSDYTHYSASNPLSITGTIGSQVGFRVTEFLTQATNNYAFYGNIPSGTGRWNLYMNGTADNYIAGNTGIGLANFGDRLTVRGSTTDNTASAFGVQNSGARLLLSVRNDGLVNLGRNTAIGTQEVAQINIVSDDTNTGLVITPKGTGAFIVGPAPDGGTAGGNARGANAVDLQILRSASNQVASGQQSVISGGAENRSTGSRSTVSGGFSNNAGGTNAVISGGTLNTASAQNSVVGGGTSNNASGNQSTIAGGEANISSSVYATVGGGLSNSATNTGASVIGGQENVASAAYSVAEGVRARAYMYGQSSTASNWFSVVGDNQTSNIRVKREITGFSTRVLSLNGVDTTASFLPVLSTPSPNISRIWNARLQCVAVTNVQGTGGPAAGSVFSETMDITIKRIGTVTSIVNGTPMQSVSVSDVGMSGADFLVDADDTNESLRVRFQPPTIAAADTQIRAVCTVYLTEIGY